jgi:hypothetical protein
MPFPPCHSRRELEPNGPLAYCAHPRMHIQGQRVHVEVCMICTLRHEPPPETFRPFPPPLSFPAAEALPRGPCRHLGEETGLRDCPTCLGNVRIKVFVCHHPAHVETTIQECLVCPDHEEREQERGERGA